MTIGVLHTTESPPGSGRGVDNFFQNRLQGGQDYRPHVLFDPSDGFEKRYLYPSDYARALNNESGGVETNRRPGGVFQVEIVGQSADCGEYDDIWYAALQEYLVYWSILLDIDYAFYEGRRLSPEEWYAPRYGWFGHRHVPENNHSDPGTLDLSRLRTPLQPQGRSVPALQDNTDISYHPGGDRSLASQTAPVTSALGWLVDSAANAEAVALRVEAALSRISVPVIADLTKVPTSALLAEVARRATP